MHLNQHFNVIMRRIFAAVAAILFCALPSFAQGKLNESADNILGKYRAVQGGEVSNTQVSKEADGTYTIKVIWLENDKEANGQKKLDVKNPDKSLRNVPADKIVLVKGLKYNKDKKQWGDAKIYDPTRGIKANCTVKFTDDGRLSIRGQVMGIGETVYWTKLD